MCSPISVAMLLGAWALCVAATLLAYPTPLWREPVGFAVWVTAMAAGVLITIGDGGGPAILPGSLVIGVALIGNHLWRYERSQEVDRVPILWASFAVAASGLLSGHSAFLVSQTPARVIGLLLFALVPPALVVGIVRPNLVDVRGLLVEAAVFTVAVIAYVAVFVGVISGAELPGADKLPTGTLALIAAVAALGFHPLRIGLRGVIDELQLDDLPAAVEVAAYRIVAEALTNVARHSRCDRAEMDLTLARGELGVDVRDHGIGQQPWRAGVGLTSMQERARTIGGTLTTRSTRAGGQVTATLPIP